MNVLQVVLPLIIRRRSIKIKLFTFSGFLFLAIALISLFWEAGQLRILFLVLGVLTLWVAGIFKDYDVIGTVTLSPNEITIEESNTRKIFELQNVQMLELQILGIEGELYSIGTASLKQGSDNLIMFRYKGVDEVYLFLLEESNIVSLRAIFEKWKQSNIEFLLENQSRQKF